MMRRLIPFISLLALLSTVPAVAAGAADIVVRDDAGRELRLAHPAQRIVTLAPHATELLFAAGGGRALVATVEYSDHPPAARQLPRVGGYETLDVERIVALKPDLVIAWGSGNPAPVVERLIAARLPVFISEPRSLDDVATSLTQFGRLAGSDAVATAAAADFRRRIDELRTRFGKRPPVRVFYQVWDEPLMTINDSHLISKVIALCGGRNVFGRLPALVPTIDTEAVLAADPDVILASEEAGARRDALDGWRRWPRLSAAKNANLFLLPPDTLVRHAPRIVDGAQAVCERLEQARLRRATDR